MSNTQILNIGIPVAIGIIGILAIGYGKSLHDDINTKPKPKLTITSNADLREAKENIRELHNEVFPAITEKMNETINKIDIIEKSLKNRSLGKSKVSTVARGSKSKRKGKSKRK